MQYGFFTDEDFQQTTPFTDRDVCVIGTLGTNTNAVKKRIFDFGASEVRTSVSRGVHYVIMGDDVPDSQLSALSDFNFHGYLSEITIRNLRNQDCKVKRIYVKEG